MKRINTIVNTTDPGQDGFSAMNSTFGKDLEALSLEYTDDDIQCRRGGGIIPYIIISAK